METEPFLDAVEADLDAVTAGDEAAAAAAGRLAGVLRTSLQLRLFDALGQAALELSDQLPAGRVEVRLAGRDVELVYAGDDPAPSPPPPDDDGGTARLTLRMPESLKAEVERTAAHEGVSTNAWLVGAVARGLDRRTRGKPGSRLTGFGQA